MLFQRHVRGNEVCAICKYSIDLNIYKCNSFYFIFITSKYSVLLIILLSLYNYVLFYGVTQKFLINRC